MRDFIQSDERWRLFLGSRPNTDLEALQDRMATLQGDSDWEPTPTQNIHFTVLFLGSCPRSVLETWLPAMAEVVSDARPIELKNGRSVLVQDQRSAMAWIRFDPADPFRDLHERSALALNHHMDRRLPFWPHLTMARTRATPPPMPEKVIIPELTIDHLTLFRSLPGERHPEYEPLESWSFK